MIRKIAFGAALALTGCQQQPSATTHASETASASASAAAMSREEQGLETPAGFVTAIYKHYVSPALTFTTLGTAAPDYYDPEMVALLAEDARLNEGYVGAIEADPICQCQDWTSIQAKVRLLEETASAAKVEVVTNDSGMSPPYSVTLVYDLVRIEGRWRIHDITGKGQSSLRAVLIRSNEAVRKMPASERSAG
jgi:hypothetical protein